MHRGGASRSRWGQYGLGRRHRGCRARLARFLPRPCRRQRCLPRLFAFQRRQHFLEIIGAGERFLRALRFGPLGCAGFTFTQPGFSEFLIQGRRCLAELCLSRRHHGCFRGGDARATFGFSIGQAQILGLGADLARHALQDQKPAQRLIRRGGLGEQGFRWPNGKPTHRRHHGCQGGGAVGRFGKSLCRCCCRRGLALLRLIQGAFGFLHARCHGNALAREAAFFGSRRFGFPCGGFRSGAAGRGGAAGFFQRFTRRLRKGKARQGQQEKRESDARLSQAANAPSWQRVAAGQASPARSAQYPPAARP